MKKSLVKILSLFVVLASFFCVLPVSAASVSGSDAVKVLEALDIAAPVEFAYFQKNYTRIEFAKMLAAIDPAFEAGVTSPKTVKDYSGEDLTAVCYAVGKNYIKLDAEGAFNPNEYVDYSTAVRALVTLLGYGPAAEQKGGNDGAYIYFAQNAGILKGIKVKDESVLLCTELAKMIINAMEVAPAEFHFDGTVIKENTLLAQRDIARYQGKLLATETRGVGADLARKGYVNIDGALYPLETAVSDYLVGKRVNYYLRGEDDSESLVCVLDATGGESFELKAHEIDSYEFGNRELTLYYDGEEEVSVPYTATVIINGKPGDLTEEIMAAFDSGSIELFDSEGNGNYNTVYATICATEVIESASIDSNTIITKNTNRKISVDAIKDATFFFENGKRASIADVTNNKVISIASDSFSVVNGEIEVDYANAKQLTIYVSGKQASGLIEAVGDDGYEIGGRTYRKSGYLEKLIKDKVEAENPTKEPVKAGRSYILYLDMNGQVCDYELDNTKSGLKYGYLIQSELQPGAFGGKLRIKLLTQEGVVSQFEFKKRYTLDNSLVDNDVLPAAFNDGRQLIRYSVEDGLIAEIDTLNLGAGETTETSISKDQPRVTDAASRPYYFERIRGFDDFRVMVPSDILVFRVPEPDQDAGDDEFLVGGIEELTNGEQLNSEAYDIGEFNAAKCLILYGSKAEAVDNLSPLYMVERLTLAVNKDGDEVYRILAHGGNGTKTLETVAASDITYMDESRAPAERKLITDIKKGDLIRYEIDALNRVYLLERRFSIADEAKIYTKPGPLLGEQGETKWGHSFLYRTSRNFYELTNNADLQNVTRADLYTSNFDSYYKSVPVYNMHTDKIYVVSSNFEEVPSYMGNADLVTVFSHWSWSFNISNAVYIWE